MDGVRHNRLLFGLSVHLAEYESVPQLHTFGSLYDPSFGNQPH